MECATMVKVTQGLARAQHYPKDSLVATENMCKEVSSTSGKGAVKWDGVAVAAQKVTAQDRALWLLWREPWGHRQV